MIDICLKDQKQANEIRSKSLGQKASNQKKLLEETKTFVNRGKENEPPAGEVEVQQLATQNGAKLGTWKRLRRDGVEAAHLSDKGSESGSKRKGAAPLKELQEEQRTGKEARKRMKWAWRVISWQSTWDWRRLLRSPVVINEYNGLEL